MRKWAVRLGVPVLLVAGFFVLRATVLAPQPVPVQVVEAARGPVEATVTNSRAGTVKSRRRVKLSPEIGGQVTAIPFREGEAVRAGAVVLRLDSSSQRATVDQARRNLETAGAERQRTCLAAERAGRELARISRLAAEGIVSADLLDQTESTRDTAEAACHAAGAAVAGAAAAVSVAEAEIAKTVLRAPFDGLVAEVSTEVGEWVTPSPPGLPIPPVVDILDPRAIYVSAPMDEVDSGRIRVGMPARVSVDSHRDQTFPGRVTRVAPYVLDLEEQNRTVEIEVELADADFAATLLPGTSADVEVILEVRADVLRIPTEALSDGRRVLLLANGRLADRQVEVGLGNWDYTEVVAGLEAGEQVVTSLDRPEVQAGAEAVLAPEVDGR